MGWIFSKGLPSKSRRKIPVDNSVSKIRCQSLRREHPMQRLLHALDGYTSRAAFHAARLRQYIQMAVAIWSYFPEFRYVLPVWLKLLSWLLLVQREFKARRSVCSWTLVGYCARHTFKSNWVHQQLRKLLKTMVPNQWYNAGSVYTAWLCQFGHLQAWRRNDS